MAAAGVPLFVIARLMGTSVSMVERHSAAFSPDAGVVHLERVFGSGAESRGANGAQKPEQDRTKTNNETAHTA
jgi:hypothetical protein